MAEGGARGKGGRRGVGMMVMDRGMRLHNNLYGGAGLGYIGR